MRLSGKKLAPLAALLAALSLGPSAHAGLQIEAGCNKLKIDAQQRPGYQKAWEDQIQKSPANARWHSCFRDPKGQADTCFETCGNRNGCPPPHNCALPGASNHQKVATADVIGLPGGIRAGCEYLYQICQNMRAQDSSLGCEIGGYPTGSHHLAVGPGIKNNAYNQCNFLKPQMGATPSNPEQLKKNGDDLFGQVMKAAPAAMQAAKALAPKDSDSGSGSKQDPAAQYPASTSPTGSNPDRSGSSSDSAGAKSPSSSPLSGEKISFHLPGDAGSSKGSGAGGPAGGGGYASDITRPSATGSSSDSSRSRALASTGSSSSSGASGGSAGGGGGSGRNGMATPEAAAASAMGEEASFAGGGGLKFNGGKSGGKSDAGLPSDSDSVVKNAIDQAEETAGRSLATKESGGIDGENGESLFTRCHAVIQRRALGGSFSSR